VSTSVAQASPPIAIRTRSERATRNLVYLIVVLPVALGSLLALPTLVFGRTLSWRLATLERRLANALLHARVQPLSPGLTTASAELIVGGVLVRALTVVAAAIAAAVPIALLCWLVVYGLEGVGGTEGRYFGPWPLDRTVGVVLFLLAVPAAVVSIAALDAVAVPLAAVSRRFLPSAAPWAVREALAASRVGELTVPTLADGESYLDILADRSAFEEFNIEAAAARGYGFVHLNQLAVEHVLGARG